MTPVGLSGAVTTGATSGYLRHAHTRWDGDRRHRLTGTRSPMWRSSTTASSTSPATSSALQTRVIDARDRVVTPGFVDIHTHLDAQLAWDPIGSSSCYHGITGVVMGNCGVTFAPCKPEDREVLAAMMESVEDIPRASDPRRAGVGLGHLRRISREHEPPAEGTQRRWHGRALCAAAVRDGRTGHRAGTRRPRTTWRP